MPDKRKRWGTRRRPTAAAGAPTAVKPAEQKPASEYEVPEITLPEGYVFEPIKEETLQETYEVIGVKFKSTSKVYYFDPCGTKYTMPGDVIVETARGVEYGELACDNKTVPMNEIVLPLHKALRPATQQDVEHYEENAAKAKEAIEVCHKLIEKHELEMKLVGAEYTFDNTKLLFYFTSDSRVDFRELVKDLAGTFRKKIELRQISIRDEARMKGGIGICGRPLCCRTFLNDFVQVSVKIAKDQNLSLNIAKMSGFCGRLMCCIKYEHDMYEEEIRKTPKVDSIVRTADGDGIVVDTLPLQGTVKVRLSAAPAGSPKTYNRDDVKLIGYAKKDNRPKKDPAADEPTEPLQPRSASSSDTPS